MTYKVRTKISNWCPVKLAVLEPRSQENPLIAVNNDPNKIAIINPIIIPATMKIAAAISLAVNIFKRLSLQSKYGRIVFQLYSLPIPFATSTTANIMPILPKIYITPVIASFKK